MSGLLVRGTRTRSGSGNPFHCLLTHTGYGYKNLPGPSGGIALQMGCNLFAQALETYRRVSIHHFQREIHPVRHFRQFEIEVMTPFAV